MQGAVHQHGVVQHFQPNAGDRQERVLEDGVVRDQPRFRKRREQSRRQPEQIEHHHPAAAAGQLQQADAVLQRVQAGGFNVQAQRLLLQQFGQHRRGLVGRGHVLDGVRVRHPRRQHRLRRRQGCRFRREQ